MKLNSQKSRWLCRRPLLMADWLAATNWMRRRRNARARWIAAVAAVTFASITVFAAAFDLATDRVASWLDALQAHWLLVLTLTTISAWFATSGRKLRVEQTLNQSWLASAPIDPRSLRRSIAIRTVAPVLSAGAAAAFAPIAAAGAHGPWRIAAALVGGSLLGAALGFWRPQRKRRRLYEGSRYTLRADASGEVVPSMAPLSRWPVAQSFAWARPDNVRPLLIVCLLLGVQGGTPAAYGLAVVATWLLGGYLVTLLIAVPHAAKSAADWLRSTPVSFGRYAWSTARLAVIHQAIGTSAAAVGLCVLGASPLAALYLGAMWLCVVTMVYAASLGDAWTGRSPGVRIALSLATMAAIESRAHAWSIPLVGLFAAWRLRGARS